MEIIDNLIIAVVKKAAIAGVKKAANFFNPSTVKGFVVTAKGNPVADATVLIGDKQDFSSSDGSFVISGIEGGTYKIKCHYGDDSFDNVSSIHLEQGRSYAVADKLYSGSEK